MESNVFYIAGMGMVSPVGSNLPMSYAVINASVSAYGISDYFDKKYNPVTLAKVPDDFFVADGEHINMLHYSGRLIKMAVQSMTEACTEYVTEQTLPCILALPELTPAVQAASSEDFASLSSMLIQLFDPLHEQYFHSLHSGRAAGMDAVEYAFGHISATQSDYVLVGGCDSYVNHSRLDELDNGDRLLTKLNPDGFAPGEGSSFLLLTSRKELALACKGAIVAVHQPGIAFEAGHLYSEEMYLGNGLDAAYKLAIKNYADATTNQQEIRAIYSSMNGERHWAKEYGVALLRSKAAFSSDVSVRHPADAMGDLGAATATTLIALAAQNLFLTESAGPHLIYSSSDYGRCGAIVIEKIALQN